jgi:hypothetical protein
MSQAPAHTELYFLLLLQISLSAYDIGPCLLKGLPLLHDCVENKVVANLSAVHNE